MSEQLELGQYIPLHYHFQMLTDEHRMGAFEEAIKRATPLGGVVAELGSGTGVLSFLASKRADHVIAVEFNPDMVKASRQLLALNGVGDRVTVIEHDAATFVPDEPVDLVICEMLHSALLREKQTAVIEQFRQGYLDKHGHVPRFMPEATLLAAQPVNQSYDFHGYHAPLPFFQPALAEVPGCQMLAPPQTYATVDYCEGDIPQHFAGTLRFDMPESVSVNAIRFITKSLLLIDPQTGSSVDWQNQYLVMPLTEPVHARAGDQLTVSFEYAAGGSIESLAASLKVACSRD